MGDDIVERSGRHAGCKNVAGLKAHVGEARCRGDGAGDADGARRKVDAGEPAFGRGERHGHQVGP